jgi:hypothetical protein
MKINSKKINMRFVLSVGILMHSQSVHAEEFLTDEEVARRLQQQYDQEYHDYQYAEKLQAEENTIDLNEYSRVIEYIKNSDLYKKRKFYVKQYASHGGDIQIILNNYKRQIIKSSYAKKQFTFSNLYAQLNKNPYLLSAAYDAQLYAFLKNMSSQNIKEFQFCSDILKNKLLHINSNQHAVDVQLRGPQVLINLTKLERLAMIDVLCDPKFRSSIGEYSVLLAIRLIAICESDYL